MCVFYPSWKVCGRSKSIANGALRIELDNLPESRRGCGSLAVGPIENIAEQKKDAFLRGSKAQ